MVQKRSHTSVRVSKLKGHATGAMISDGRVHREDKEGNDAADIAADFGRLRQPVFDARQNLLRGKCALGCFRSIGLWFPSLGISEFWRWRWFHC